MSTDDKTFTFYGDKDWTLPEAEVIIPVKHVRLRLLFILLNPFEKQITLKLFPTPEERPVETIL
jgi:hypothetical protein